jgi:hypothetical protein
MNTSRRIFWLADKAFALHTLASLALCVWLASQGLAIAGLPVLVMWILAAAIWQEWKHG